MNAFRMASSNLFRNLRAGQLNVLIVALVVAVSALTSVGFFTDRVGKAVAREASTILAADLRLRATEAPDGTYVEQAKSLGLLTAEVVTFPSVVISEDDSQLAAIHAVSSGYPLRGELLIADELFGSNRAADDVPPPGEAWADGELLARLGLSTGDTVTLGAIQVVLSRVVQYRPDQAVGFVGLAPDLLINIEDLEATELVRPGSRITWSLLFAGTEDQITEMTGFIEQRRQPGERLQTIGDSGEQIRSALDRAQSFLSLAALISVLLAATAVAVAARRYASTQIDAVALMKSMGASQWFITKATLWELAMLGLAAGLIGAGIGYVAQEVIASLAAALIDGGLPSAGPLPVLSGIVTSMAVLAGFALPSMLALRTVPPLRVLRHDAEPRPVSAAVSYSSAIAIVVGLLIWLIGWGPLLGFTLVGLSIGALLLVAAGWGLVAAVKPLRNASGVAWRYGLANIARRGSESVAQIVAFGFGFAVLLLLSLVRTDLLDAWRANLPEDAPNHFLINVQPNEVEGVQAIFSDNGLEPPALAALVRARMTAINDVPVTEIDAEGEGGRLMERESNLTWSLELDPSNKLLSGSWWDPDDTEPQLSVEQDVARDLGLELGDRISFGVAGQTVAGTVTSVRTVGWDSFRPNFYFVFNPVALQDAPATFISGVYVPEQQREVLLKLVRAYPGVSVIDLESVLTQVRSVMDRAALAVQYVFLFTLLAGIAVLLAAVQATREERRYETAMLRTLGASRRLVRAGVLAEFLGLGVLAGTLATVVANGVAYSLATNVFQLDYQPALLWWLAGPVAGAILVGCAGALATRSVVSQPPVGVLRSQG